MGSAGRVYEEEEGAGGLADEDAGDFSKEDTALAVALHGAGDEEADACGLDGLGDGRRWELGMAPVDGGAVGDAGEGLGKAGLVFRGGLARVDDDEGAGEQPGDGPGLREHGQKARRVS